MTSPGKGGTGKPVGVDAPAAIDLTNPVEMEVKAEAEPMEMGSANAETSVTQGERRTKAAEVDTPLAGGDAANPGPCPNALPEATLAVVNATVGDAEGSSEAQSGKAARNKKKREKLKAKKRLGNLPNQMAAMNPNGDFSFLERSKVGLPSTSTDESPKADGAPKKRGVNTISPEGVNVAKKPRDIPFVKLAASPRDVAEAKALQAQAKTKAPQAKAPPKAGPFTTTNPGQNRLDGRAGDPLAVLIFDGEGSRIEESESEEILSMIMTQMLELPEDLGNIGCTSPPILDEGKITVFCANAETKSWLVRVVGTLSLGGRDLQAAGWDEWEGKSKIRVFFPQNPGSPDLILKCFQKQNACVTDTSLWKVISCKDADGGVGKIALLLLPKEAAEAVKKAGNKLFCQFMTAKVTQCGGGQTTGKAVAASKS